MILSLENFKQGEISLKGLHNLDFHIFSKNKLITVSPFHPEEYN